MVELSQLLGEKENLSYGNGGIRTCNLRLAVECCTSSEMNGPTYACTKLLAVHDMSYRTHGVLDQCAACT